MARDSTRTSESVENALQGLPSTGGDTWECIHGFLFLTAWNCPRDGYNLQGRGWKWFWHLQSHQPHQKWKSRSPQGSEPEAKNTCLKTSVQRIESSLWTWLHPFWKPLHLCLLDRNTMPLSIPTSSFPSQPAFQFWSQTVFSPFEENKVERWLLTS